MLHKQYFLALCQLNTGMSDEEAQGFYHAIKQLMDDDCEPWDCPPPYLELAG
jgi:hypothetical protein